MTLRWAIDHYMADMIAEGRINSPTTERTYRAALMCHAEDVSNRDPRCTNREDVKRTLGRWKHPNTRSQSHAILRAFYDWAMEEGHRSDNPARQVRKAKRRQPTRYRLTSDETVRVLEAARGTRERRCISLGICAGLRRGELAGMQGRHFRRPGLVWVSADIGKGRKERWIPVIETLEPVWLEIAQSVADNEYVVPPQHFNDPGRNHVAVDDATKPPCPQVIWRIVRDAGRRAALPAEIAPHTLRHAFCDHVARHAGVRVAQIVMGHAGMETTEGYLGKPTVDELLASMQGLRIEAASAGPKSQRAE